MGERKLSEDASIIPFPTKKNEDASDTISITPEYIEKILAECENDYELRDVLDAYFVAIIIFQFPEKTVDNPFGPVYLSALLPDTISTLDLNTVMKFSDIQDLSDEIKFEDGLDDY